MMKGRRISREIAVQLLYQWELQGFLARKLDQPVNFLDTIDLANFLGHFLHNFYLKDKTEIDTTFILDLIRGTIKNIVEVDGILDGASPKWKLARMDAIDRAILRIACYELLIKRLLSERIIINEAVEIAKRYGSEQSPAFINGVLDGIKGHKETSPNSH